MERQSMIMYCAMFKVKIPVSHLALASISTQLICAISVGSLKAASLVPEKLNTSHKVDPKLIIAVPE